MPHPAAEFADAPQARADRREATDDEARALASSLRLRILRICLHEARTNKQIAEVLGRDPASTLHHVRRLVDTGFLVAEQSRRGTRGSREIPYRATGKSWRVSTPSKSGTLLDAFVEEVALVPVESVRAARVGLRLSRADAEDFEARLLEVVDEFIAKSDDADVSEAISMFFAIHPDPNNS